MKSKNTIFTIILWLLIVCLSYYWNIVTIDKKIDRIVLAQGQSFFSEIQTTRTWNAQHGGVYVPVSDRTVPNPNLAHIPDRDFISPSGKYQHLKPPFSYRLSIIYI